MKYLILLGLISFLFSSQTAVLEDGTKVQLNDDFTWEYLKDIEGEIEQNEKIILRKNQNLSKMVKSKKYPYVIYYDQKKYDVEQSRGLKEFVFQAKDKTCYFQTIVEKDFLSLDVLVEAAVINARSAAYELEVIGRGDVVINGLDGKYLIMNAKIRTYEFTYYGFYFSSPEVGSIQLLTWTFTSMFDKKKLQLEEMVSGFEIIQTVR